MKRTLVALTLLLTIFLPLTASAEWAYGKPVRQAGNLGIGFGAGTFADGLSGKYFMDSEFAIQGVVGVYGSRYNDRYSSYCRDHFCSNNDAIGLSVDFLWEMPVIVGNGKVDLGWNVGLGPALALHDDNGRDDNVWVAVAGVVGLELLINVIPIDLVIEYRPAILVVPGVHIDEVNFTGHIRFFF